MEDNLFGYPIECKKCHTFSDCSLNVKPYYKQGGDKRLMLIGQDPTIFGKQERVKKVLMLDDPNSNLSRWLRGMFGRDRFNDLTIYATNLVKCTFSKPPSLSNGGGLRFLKPHFQNCKEHLKSEIQQFQPTLVMTLGEPAHVLFRSLLEEPDKIHGDMKNAFTGDFVPLTVGRVEFSYSPCLHIKTFRVAETYGERVGKFKESLKHTF